MGCAHSGHPRLPPPPPFFSLQIIGIICNTTTLLALDSSAFGTIYTPCNVKACKIAVYHLRFCQKRWF